MKKNIPFTVRENKLMNLQKLIKKKVIIIANLLLKNI